MTFRVLSPDAEWNSGILGNSKNLLDYLEFHGCILTRVTERKNRAVLLDLSFLPVGCRIWAPVSHLSPSPF